jgi:hypothetical protein
MTRCVSHISGVDPALEGSWVICCPHVSEIITATAELRGDT